MRGVVRLRLVTVEAMRAMDRRAVERYGIPVRALMEAAGAALAREALDLRGAGPGPALFLCGGGNNGGDGLAAARHLLARGVPAEVLLWSAPERLGDEPGANWNALRLMGARAEAVPGVVPPDLAGRLAAAGVVVDCRVGVGVRGRLRAPLDAVVEAVAACGRPVLAADIPSGCDADGGPIEGPCVPAVRTICFGAAKYGCLVHPGAVFAGEVRVDPIGIPPEPAGGPPAIVLTEKADAAAGVPRRTPDGHKGTFGRVVVVGGSVGFAGAPAMAAQAALAAGAGLVILAVPEPLAVPLAAKLTEVMVRALPADRGGFAASAGGALLDLAAGADVLVLGPGLGRGPAAAGVVAALLGDFGGPIVLDADGLNAATPAMVAGAAGSVVLTPHPGEMARFLGLKAAQVTADRLETVRRAASEAKAVAVLKGARTLVAEPAGRVWVNPTGNDGMATAGSGDVLSGVVAALLAQGAEPAEGTVAAVYLHGVAGDCAAERLGRRSLLAGDLITALPEAFLRILPPSQW
jgi:hydroxyethylthiazole kinase-like uncharacterized protein yjeF